MQRLAVGTSHERSALLGVCVLAVVGCFLGLAVPPSASAESLFQQALALVRVLSTTALAAVLIVGPGMAWRAGQVHRRLELGFLPLPGLALLAGTGGLAWALADRISPRLVCACVLIPALGWLLVRLLRAGSGETLEAEERYALVAIGCVFGLAVARALWSLGPMGELYAGTIQRTLEVGDRSDSRISFHVVQLVAHGTAPYSALGGAYFVPFTFSDRGALAGLASAPLVLLTGGRPPTGLPLRETLVGRVSAGPDAPWLPFDPEGFMAYRLAMMAFACTAFLSLWTLTRRLAGAGAAHLALLLAVTTPFLVHEVWFTWPKLLAASLVLLAAVALMEGRALAAGSLVGIGYLVHPLALLSVPVLVLLALWPPWSVGLRAWRPRLAPALALLTGVAVCLLAWRLINGSHYTQSNFLDYLTVAGATDPVTISAWFSHRLESVANTLVPLRLFLFSAGDPSVNVVGGSSPPVVHFFFQYWTTLPFGIGIVFFPLLLVSLWRAARLWTWPFLAAVIVPFGAFAIYWGTVSTGMLREGLHVWILTLFAVVALEQRQRGFAWLRSQWARALLALRSVEVLLVAVLPTFVTRDRVYDQRFAFTDVLALAAMLFFAACLGMLVWRERPGGAASRPIRGFMLPRR